MYQIIKSLFINRSIRHQHNFSIENLFHWGLGVNDCGAAEVSGMGLKRLTEEYGTPLLVVNRHKLVEDAVSIRQALPRCAQGSRVVYSYKTNCVPGILKELHNYGLGAEVISPYELWLADQLGVAPDDIVYNGVNKTDASLVRAVEMGILSINIDSLPEVEKIVAVAKRLNKKAQVGVRLAFSSSTQFGLDIDTGEAMEACIQIQKYSEWLDMVMLHFSVTSNAKNSNTHSYFAQRALEFAQTVKERTGLKIRYLDVGGGIGVPTSKNMSGAEYGMYRLFGCLPKPPDPNGFEDINIFIDRIQKTVKDTCEKLGLDMPGLVLEPGRFVTSRGEFLLSTVQTVKKKSDGTRFVITDAGRLSITYPMDFEYHAIFTADQTPGRKRIPQNIMGRICTSADWMAKNVLLPELEDGDILVTMDAGAYFSSYSSNFSFPRPAIVMVNDDGSVEVLREAETFEHLVAMDTMFK